MCNYGKKIDEFSASGAAFTAESAAKYGIPRSALAYYAQTGKLHRLCHGVYQTAESNAVNSYPDLEQLVRKNADFVICLLSALRLHNITTQLPACLWIAIPQGRKIPKFAGSPPTVVRMGKKPYSYGVETLKVENLPVRIYSPAKTVADCFKFRNKFGLDVALEALEDGYRKKRFNVEQLMEAATVCRVQNIIRPYAEMMLK